MSVLRRLVTLLSQQAMLLATNEAFRKQAESATDAAKKYMEENETLQKSLKEAGIELKEKGEHQDIEKENEKLKTDMRELKNEVQETKKSNVSLDCGRKPEPRDEIINAEA
eukprot:g31119.t1